ncbi:dihydroorotase [Candidatus Endowatersipora endosymbiont of Watersipora subatra]|uniref:dihydroorotase n=1 Tax=Candidatus Endowatersipora endosymbiont of Watersipora subatra TaxID=3077946 RepID=UPI00312CB9D3
MSKSVIIRRPDDWHLHLRDGEMLKSIIRFTSQHFSRAIVMPNLFPPIVNSQDAIFYRNLILSAIPEGHIFQPLMTLYLTEGTDPDDVEKAAANRVIHAVKFYPVGASTNSQFGIFDLERVRPILERMSEIGLPLCVHGEVTDPEIDIFDREAVFIDRVLDPLRTRMPELKVIMEHITTSDAVDYVSQASSLLAATITPHHLIINRNHILVGGIHPHYYCLPVAKRQKHRQALRIAATSGSSHFFLGTDSAPHVTSMKENACGCAGCFTSINTMSLLAHVFEEEESLENLEPFSSLNGPKFYALEANTETLILKKQSEPVLWPKQIQTREGNVTVFDPGFDVYWQVEG